MPGAKYVQPAQDGFVPPAPPELMSSEDRRQLFAALLARSMRGRAPPQPQPPPAVALMPQVPGLQAPGAPGVKGTG